jgi:quinoprotein glucose dehydrogenase
MKPFDAGSRALPMLCAIGVSLAGILAVSLAGATPPSIRLPDRADHADWPVYRGNPGGTQYSSLAFIHAANVHALQPAWVYHTGDANQRSTMHVNPVVVGGVMYVTTPSLKAVALDAATGREIWAFDPSKYSEDHAVIRLRNRGVTYWKGAAGERIFHFVRDRVYALDAKTGELIVSFGKRGYIDLRENLGVDPATVSLEMTSPGAVYKDLLVLGSRVNESYDASPGHVRAYDATTGRLRWIFHTIPQAGEFGSDTWTRVEGENYGGANAWGGITVDERRGWVFCATGSATDDFYGAFRQGANLFADSVLALDAVTGERKWHYQTVHHDLWDYDNPPAPILATITTGGRSRDVVVQLTKMGFTFVLDRETGESLFPVQEVPVPRSTVPGEAAWPTQPFPLTPRPLVRQSLTEADLTNISPASRAYALREFAKYRSGSIYTPPTVQGTLTLPGHLGGSEWHGAAFDPGLNVLYVNVNDAPTINRLRPMHSLPAGTSATPLQLGRWIYERTCASCHGTERQGFPPLTPALLNVAIGRPGIEAVILQGRNAMPAFRQFTARELSAVVEYVTSAAGSGERDATLQGAPERYTLEEYKVFTDEDGVPAVAPPWGTLNALDLSTGDLLWKVPLGEYPQLVAKGIRNTGAMNFGGAVATAGGIVFIAATPDEKFRAFESHSGRVLWEYQLPAGGYATPSVYLAGGREYVAIAAGGGGKNATKSGDAIIAFALPGDRDTAAQSRPPAKADGTADTNRAAAAGWTELFDGSTLNGWVHLNGAHQYTVEDGAIVGRTVERSASQNSFLCALPEFDDFELELETMVDRTTNQGIQIRTRVRPVAGPGTGPEYAPGRVYGPQVEVRRFYKGLPTTGVLYGEALGTGWLSSRQKIENGHHYFLDEGWNRLRILANGPRIQTWVNGQPVEDLVNEDVYRTHPSGRICLQIHGLSERELSGPYAGSGLTPAEPLVSRWRHLRVRHIDK